MRRRGESFAERRARHAVVEDPEAVLDAAARLLESRARSTTEVTRRLMDAGYRPALVSGAVTRLSDLGMLDDRAFARAWIESRDRAHPRGERALRRELLVKGIDRSTIDELLTERRDRGSDAGAVDTTAAEVLLARHARTLERVPDPRARWRRAYALLARNGFDPETAADVARRFVDAAGGSDEP